MTILMFAAMVRRLNKVAYMACDPACQGRCKECPADVIRKAAAFIASSGRDAERYRYCVAEGLLDGTVEGYCAEHDLDEAGLCDTPEYKALADAAIDAKKEKVEKYMNYARSIGTLGAE